MGAVANHYDIKTIVRQILAADIDIALICHKGPNIELAFEEIVKQLSDTPELRAKAIESVRRIMKLKRRYIEI
jgi:beta-N-acetylhexosaminidase